MSPPKATLTTEIAGPQQETVPGLFDGGACCCRLQALAAAMRKLQEEWWLLVVQLEHQQMQGQLSLAGLVYYCQAPAASMDLLATIAVSVACDNTCCECKVYSSFAVVVELIKREPDLASWARKFASGMPALDAPDKSRSLYTNSRFVPVPYDEHTSLKFT